MGVQSLVQELRSYMLWSSSVQSLSHVRLFANPWTAARQASLSTTNPRTSPKPISIIVQLSHPYMTTGKTIALTRWTFVGKVLSLLFNILSRLVITFLPRSKHLLISWLQSPSAVIFGAPKNKVWHCFHCFPIYLPWSDGTRCHDLHFLNVEL